MRSVIEPNAVLRSEYLTLPPMVSKTLSWQTTERRYPPYRVGGDVGELLVERLHIEGKDLDGNAVNEDIVEYPGGATLAMLQSLRLDGPVWEPGQTLTMVVSNRSCATFHPTVAVVMNIAPMNIAPMNAAPAEHCRSPEHPGGFVPCPACGRSDAIGPPTRREARRAELAREAREAGLPLPPALIATAADAMATLLGRDASRGLTVDDDEGQAWETPQDEGP